MRQNEWESGRAERRRREGNIGRARFPGKTTDARNSSVSEEKFHLSLSDKWRERERERERAARLLALAVGDLSAGGNNIDNDNTHSPRPAADSH